MLDLKGGRAVHAVAGQRAYYQPVQSILHATSDPLELATALRENLGLDTLYLADLDAIAGDAPDLTLYQKLIASGFYLIVDAGLRDLRSAKRLLALDRSSSAIVAGLETLEGPDDLREIVHEVDAARTIFSLDLDEGRPRKPETSGWKSDDPFELASEAIALWRATGSPARPRAGRNGPRIGDHAFDRAAAGQSSRSPRQYRRWNLRHFGCSRVSRMPVPPPCWSLRRFTMGESGGKSYSAFE